MEARVADVDDELGPVRVCARCHEDWPDDDEFYEPDKTICRACVADFDDHLASLNRERVRRFRRRLKQGRMG